ncbi:MAG: PAS domain S-box protein [Nitrospirae bacterium]|nr:PAS domain S-box protein [Nitrospirota bacterium]
MKRGGIKLKIITPIVLLMVVFAVLALLRTGFIISDVLDHYRQDIIRQDKHRISMSLKGKKNIKDIIDTLKTILDETYYKYRVVSKNRILYESAGFPLSIYTGKSGFLRDKKKNDLIGFKYRIKNTDDDIIVFRSIPLTIKLEKDLGSTLTIYSLSVVLMIISLLLIMKRNFVNPIRNIITKINKGECAQPVNIKEIDNLIEVINDALATVELKKQQMEILHNIAVSLNKDMTFDEIMDTILERSRVLIDANLSAFALYDEEGRFKTLRVYGLDGRRVFQRIGHLPEGRGILELMKLSLVPVRINDLEHHPAFSGSFPEGHPVIKNFIGYPIYSSTGKPLGALYFANKRNGEFTEEDERTLMAIASDTAVAIQRVRELEEIRRFKKIMESAFDIIVITDSEGKIRYVNNAFQSLTGYSREEVLGVSPAILKSGLHEDDFYKELWETITSGRVWKGEFINKKKDGELYIASAAIYPLFSEKGEITHFVSIQRDITEEKKLYEQLLRAQKMEAIGTLAGGIAHDFNNILSAILGYAEILKEELGGNHKLSKAVNIIENSAQRGSDLARQILNITRKEKMELKVININRIINDSLEVLKRSIPKDIELDISLQEGLPPVKADPTQMQQMIMNLAINARDAMSTGGKLTISTSKVGNENGAANDLVSDNGYIKISVSDTGTGIEKDMQTKIFDPFFTTKERGSGTGLGLYIVHSIVTNHGGYINLYSEPGKGTRFNIYLPVYHGKVESEDRDYKLDDLKGAGLILVIDDELEIRELTKDILCPLGYDVIAAHNGSEGLRIFRQRRKEISLVILDMIMPKMNGAEVFQRLKNIDDRVKVLLSSGYSHEGLAGINELIKSGVRGFIQKPFTRKTLARKIKEILSEK